MHCKKHLLWSNKIILNTSWNSAVPNAHIGQILNKFDRVEKGLQILSVWWPYLHFAFLPKYLWCMKLVIQYNTFPLCSSFHLRCQRILPTCNSSLYHCFSKSCSTQLLKVNWASYLLCRHNEWKTIHEGILGYSHDSKFTVNCMCIFPRVIYLFHFILYVYVSLHIYRFPVEYFTTSLDEVICWLTNFD